MDVFKKKVYPQKLKPFLSQSVNTALSAIKLDMEVYTDWLTFVDSLKWTLEELQVGLISVLFFSLKVVLFSDQVYFFTLDGVTGFSSAQTGNYHSS